MSDVHPFNIMAKPVSGVCNLDCRYCYYTAKPRELYAGVDRFMMSPEVLEAYTRQYLELVPAATFGWQGGEPLLAGKGFFQSALDLQARYKRDGQEISNAIQTNGTLLDDEWCEFLAANKFLVGLSLDGPPQWHDSFRRDHQGNPTFHRAWAGLELLRKHNVEFNVLVTLNRTNAPHAGDIYRYFVNRGVQYLQFIPILERTPDGAPTDFSCTPDQLGRFMVDVYEQWASRDVGRVSERMIDNVLHTLIFGRAAMCCQSQRCGNAHVLEFNGDLYACDHFVYKEWRIGNIIERPLADLVTDPRLEEFAQLKTQLPDACRECEFLPFCNGGCPKHHMPIGTAASRASYFCEGYKAFFRHALSELAEMAQYFKRNQTPPPRTAAAPKTAAAPGRNDPCPCGTGRKFKNCCGQK